MGTVERLREKTFTRRGLVQSSNSKEVRLLKHKLRTEKRISRIIWTAWEADRTRILSNHSREKVLVIRNYEIKMRDLLLNSEQSKPVTERQDKLQLHNQSWFLWIIIVLSWLLAITCWVYYRRATGGKKEVASEKVKVRTS